MKKGTTIPPNPNKRVTRQILLSPAEYNELYTLADLPRTENDSQAVRTVLRGYRDQINENANLRQHLKQLSK